MPKDETTTEAPEEGTKPAERKGVSPGVRYTLVAALVLVLIALGVREGYQRFVYVYEYDARVAGTLITVSSRVAGWVTEVGVKEGDEIKSGRVLMRIDARESQLLIAQYEAQLRAMQAEQSRLNAERVLIDQQTSSRYNTQASELNTAKAEVSSIKPELDLAQSELGRAEALFKQRVISRQVLDKARATAQRLNGEMRVAVAKRYGAEAKLKEAEAERARLNVLDGQLNILKHRMSEIRVKTDQQKLDVADRVIRAAINGVVDRTFVDQGEYVTPGQRLVLIHDPSRVWVEANVKETEVRRLTIGQTVRVTIDAYPDREFTGRVDTIGNAATSEFALLPSPNPSGNFTKVTQRLRVRISVEQTEKLLRPGMMAEVYIDVGEH